MPNTNYKKLSYYELFNLFDKKCGTCYRGSLINEFLDKCSLIQRAHICNYMAVEYYIPNQYMHWNASRRKIPAKFRSLRDKNDRIYKLIHKLEDAEELAFHVRKSFSKMKTSDFLLLKTHESFEAYEGFTLYKKDSELKKYERNMRRALKVSDQIDKVYKLRSLL